MVGPSGEDGSADFFKLRAVVSAGLVATVVDAGAPGLLTGLFLTGSAVLGDWRIGQSDIDLVGVLRRAPTAAEREILARAMTGGPDRFDALWLTEADLVSPPSDPMVAVALRTLALHGVAVRGEPPADLWDNADLLARLLRSNLAGYWAGWLSRARNPTRLLNWRMLGGWAPPWGVLGVARIAYTLETGDIISKTGAGRWARTRFPDHARVLTECLRLRTGKGARTYRGPFNRRRDALAAMAAIMAASRGSGS